jgi:hypothetical protein
MKNLLFHLKAVKTGTLKALVGARAGSGAGAGAETSKVGAGVGVGAVTKSFGSATLYQGVILSVCRPVTSVLVLRIRFRMDPHSIRFLVPDLDPLGMRIQI